MEMPTLGLQRLKTRFSKSKFKLFLKNLCIYFFRELRAARQTLRKESSKSVPLHTTEIWNITEEIDLKNGTFMSNKRSIIFLQNTLRFPRQRNILVHFRRVFVNWTTYRKLNIRLVEYWMHEQSKIGYSTSHIRDMNKKKMFD